MRFWADARTIFRMADNRPLLRRIDELRRKAGIPSVRQLCIAAGVSPETIRLLKRGHPPVRERLRGLARVLNCELSYLEEVAPDVRLDSRDEDARELLDMYESLPPDRRDAFLESVKSVRRLIPD